MLKQKWVSGGLNRLIFSFSAVSVFSYLGIKSKCQLVEVTSLDFNFSYNVLFLLYNSFLMFLLIVAVNIQRDTYSMTEI